MSEQMGNGMISRRKLLKSMGAAGAAAVMFGTMVNVTNGKDDTSVTDSVYGKDGKKKPLNVADLACVVSTTIEELRALTDLNADSAYLVTNAGQEGHYVYDPADTTSTDNIGLIVVSTGGARFKRLLETPYLNVKWFGAKGDGVTDDMAAIQRTLDAASARGGGTVFIPNGTYIVSPSGQNRLFLRNNVNLLGEGTSTVIKVKDNAGDYGMIFGANSSTPLRDVRISHLRVDQNPQNNLTCNIDSSRTDSYYWQFAIALYNYENIVIDNVTFDPTCGKNTITLNKITAKNAIITNCRFNFVRAKGDPDYDNSAIYLNGRSHTVSNCLFYSDPSQKARGAIETHAGTSVISNNISDGYYTGINLQSSESSGEHCDMTVTNNTISNANQGIQFGPRLQHGIKNVVISNNTIHLINTVHLRTLTTGISTAGSSEDVGPHENITITGNTIVFEEEFTRRSSLNEGAYGISLYRNCNYTNVVISDNLIRNAPVTGIRVGSTAKVGVSTNIKISGNMIVNAGHYPATSELYRAGILLRSTVNGADISGNYISDTYDEAKGLFSIRVNDFDGTFTNVSVKNNLITTKQGGLWFSVSPSVQMDAPPAKTVTTFPPTSGTYIQGEIVLVTGLSVDAGKTPAGFKVTSTGSAGTLTSVTGTGTSGTPYLVVNDVSQLQPEQWIRIEQGNQLRRIVRISGNQLRLNANLTAAATSSPVAFAAPGYLAFGSIGKLPAVPDTSGSNLEQLELEVNQLKQRMRDYGMIF
ncbi:glycosyl hydrolase family 28-related protein [Paenibacillus allorhizosphaerae]|uniref:Rhamnogalacturonase A/B/Epimerase-like pectate lyase domain-containing protein n=1 Tax=Paenibacillus allorhizosphaerae TaxID=2849866 RepID=A0ABN7TAL0_9BACL|nr:right-handed parallel beta-helix repeat-containing protein [Paenibacillus allorhizosphaerae]CAG7614485.1 hypothetical protein PAECIP111802_00078 [Paenibacillus allorhizosphaerae]